MSEEEIIETLTNYNLVNHFNNIKFFEALKCLLIMYNQEKEKNKELLYKLEVEKIDNKYNKEEAQEEMIPKYKIRAKIEYYKIKCKDCKFDKYFCKQLNKSYLCSVRNIQKLLQELLEE